MKSHPTLWLSAYHDGQLNQEQAFIVKRHLEECSACQRELAQLTQLSELLQNAPPASLPISPELFVDQVMTKIQATPKSAQANVPHNASWWLAPALLVIAWAFAQALIFISGLLFQFEPMRALFRITPGSQNLLQQLLGITPFTGAAHWVSSLLGALPGGSVLLLFLFNILISSLVAFLLASWLAGWYAYRKHEPLIVVENRFLTG